MATNQVASSSASGDKPAQEYTVRVPKNSNKKYMVMKFNTNAAVDFTKCGSASLVRENNLKEYKLSNDLDQMPKFGAGSEYGRDMREEARRKKYGIMVKKYNPEDQPWQLKSGKGKESRKHKGVKEGGILANVSYFIFTQCADGAFEAFPLEEWYNFTPVIKYKYLNSEEAEEEFTRRDKILNHFTIMTKKRLKNEGDDADDEDEKPVKGKGKAKSKKKDFLLTDLDEWAHLTDEEGSDDDDDGEKDGSDSEKPKKKKGKKPKKQKGKKSNKANSGDEALEDSDSVDEGQEVDYMTDTDSEDENMYAEQSKMKTNKYETKGVDQEENSDEEEEEEEEEKKEEQQEEEEGEEEKKKESESESSGSDSDSDPEKEVSQFSSALFMQPGSGKKSKKSGESSKSNSRSATPTSQVDAEGGEKAKKRKPTDAADGATSAKKPKSDGPPLTGSDGVTEEIIRKYLMRKPMTIKDLLQKLHKNTGIQKGKLSETIAPILRRINPDKLKVNDKLHLHIKNKKAS